MSDYLVDLGQNQFASTLIKNLGLPIPTPQALARPKGAYENEPLNGQTALVGAVPGGEATVALLQTLDDMGADMIAIGYGEATQGLHAAAEKARVKPQVFAPHTAPKNTKAHALVFDATGAQKPADLKAAYEFFHDNISRLKASGRIVLLARTPALEKSLPASVTARAVEGLMRSLGKEIGKRGATANLIYVQSGAESRTDGVLRFLLSSNSAYVSGQAFQVTKAVKAPSNTPVTNVLAGKIALVTGAARGIGAATAKRLAAEGAHVICLDVPFDEETLNKTAAEVNGTPLPMDVTDNSSPRRIATFIKERGGVDIVVHNAGITRDKTIARMKPHLWEQVVAVNLEAILNIDTALLEAEAINKDGRIVCLSSIGGIAGNVGQTNYAATKAGVIGYVESAAAIMAKQQICVNAVAPGFIETRMTAAMPFAIREAGRRLNSLSQGGQPEDVAELITFLSTPGAAGVTGNVIRVCGQSLVGA